MVQVVLKEHEPEWAVLFVQARTQIEAALGRNALMVEHVGSTSIPDICAKPIIDMLLVVPDSTLESDYLEALELAEFSFHLREPHWYEHRLFKREEPPVNLHVFSQGCAEIERMLVFRDYLRAEPTARRVYEDRKRCLAEQEWATIQAYADAKSGVIESLIAAARIARRSRLGRT